MIAIYARVSTEEQAKHGFSLADQLRECRQKAGAKPVLEYVDEGESGEFLDRPQLARLREDLRRGIISQVICLDPDRLSRKLMNQLMITDEIEARAKLVFVNGDYAKTPEGQLFYQMRGAISQFEKAKINERMTRGRREKARQGKVLRDYHIYGYDFDAASGQFTINEREAEVVRLIFDLFVHPRERVHGLNGIARYLNERKIPSKHGKNFHRQVIRQMLMNPVYIGNFYQNKWNAEGVLGNKYRKPEDRVRQHLRPPSEWIHISVPPIVSHEQFELAGRLLEQSRRRSAGRSERQYLLGGLLRCRQCGNTLTGRRQTNWGKTVVLYTDRKSGANAKNPGCGTTIPCEELDRRVWQALVEWVSAPAVADQTALSLFPEHSALQSERDVVCRELARVEQGINRVLELMLDSELDEDSLRDKLKQLQNRKRSLTQEQLRLQALTDEPCGFIERDLQRVWIDFEHLTYDELSIDVKKTLIRSAIKEIRVDQEGNTVEIETF